jgi:hypothetical protein
MAGVAAFGAQISGSRVALFGGGLLFVVALAVTRPPLRKAATLAGSALAGVVVSAVFLTQDDSSTERLTSESAGFVFRADVWRHGVDAWTQRPLIGWGAGRFQEAMAGQLTLADKRGGAPDTLYQLYFDAHNLFVEHLTTTGFVGLGLLIAFVVVAVRRTRGPLVWLAAGIGITWLLEPVSVAVAPVALLALGAAAPPRPDAPTRSVRLLAGSFAGAGLLVGLAMIWGGYQLRRAEDDSDLAAVQRAELVYWRDASVADLRMQIRLAEYQESRSDERLDALLRDATRAVRFEPANVRWWSRLGALRLYGSDPAGALEAFDRALALNPWSESVWQGVREAADQVHDERKLEEAERRLCLLDEAQCGE